MVVDYKMPGMNGFEVFEQARAASSRAWRACWSPVTARPTSSTRRRAWIRLHPAQALHVRRAARGRREGPRGPSLKRGEGAAAARARARRRKRREIIDGCSMRGAIQWAARPHARRSATAWSTTTSVARSSPTSGCRPRCVSWSKPRSPRGPSRRDVRVLDVACGPGNFTFVAGRGRLHRARASTPTPRWSSWRARSGGRAIWPTSPSGTATSLRGNTFRDESFDQVVNIHSLYVHADAAAPARARPSGSSSRAGTRSS